MLMSHLSEKVNIVNLNHPFYISQDSNDNTFKNTPWLFTTSIYYMFCNVWLHPPLYHWSKFIAGKQPSDVFRSARRCGLISV